MDLSKYNGCQGGVQLKNKLENTGTNNVHTKCGTSDEVEHGANDYTLKTKKTEMNIPHEKSGSPFLAGILNSRLSANDSGSKTAMDLSFHVNLDDSSKTIFEDADYFSRNYLYKLMPITLEAVNEKIIHIEHNYCNFGSSVGASDESKTIHGDGEERNYKKRKSKSGDGLFSLDIEKDEETVATSVSLKGEQKMDDEYSVPIQPLDLSLSVYHEQKTDKMLKENQSNIPKTKLDHKNAPDPKQFDMCESNKENVTSARKIEVTISRPGQKEYYEPCEVFLNDVARISPDLVKNDCYEIDIIDRTRQDPQKERCRTYYIVSESTWQTFENSTERIILTNDLNLGEPIQNKENLEKPTYLIFDQYSLTESLVEICENKGGRFEYTCLKESMPKAQEIKREVQDCGIAINRVTLDEESNVDTGKRHSTETNIEKNLLKNGDTEEVADKPEEQRLETEEEVCGKDEETEAMECKPDDTVAENDERDQKPGKIKTERELDEDIQCATCEEYGDGQKMGKTEEADDSQESSRTKQTDDSRRNEIAARDSPPIKKSTAAKGLTRKKRKLNEVKKALEEDVRISKRVTRSRVSLTEEVPQEVEKPKNSKRKTQTKAESTVSKRKVMESTKTPKRTKLKQNVKESSSTKGKDTRRKRSDADIGTSNMRETRSTTKKAVRNRRRK